MHASDYDGLGESVQSICTRILDKPPCCISTCPVDRTLLAIGTYNLIDDKTIAHDMYTSGADSPIKSQHRDGAVLLYRAFAENLELQDRCELQSGVLDVHWLKLDANFVILGAATSTGLLELFQHMQTPGEAIPACSLRPMKTLRLAPPDAVVTSFKWDVRDELEDPILRIWFTLSTGEVQISQVPTRVIAEANRNAAQSQPTISSPAMGPYDCAPNVHTIYRHDAEAWIVQSATRCTGNVTGVWSGGDDLTIQWSPCATTGQGPLEASRANAAHWSDNRIHTNGGVVEIIPITPSIIAVGSYDDHFRILKEPSKQSHRRRPLILAEVKLGGGVWRLYPVGGQVPRFRNGRRFRILACCMYAGARVLEIEMSDTDEWPVHVLARFEEHTSMCYGGAVWHEDGSDGRDRYVTCSFYDKKLCLWRY